MKRIVKALVTVDPEHAGKIASGEKTVQYSKTHMREEPEAFIICTRDPEDKVFGEAEIVECIGASPERLWEWTQGESGMSEDEFYEFFRGRSFGYAYKLGRYTDYGGKVSLYSLVSRPPRSFTYIFSGGPKYVRQEAKA